ncbi:MAG TPA: VOC family protein [Phycisphaerales bacterium]|nr:VOC family protein [Phycisphaerales bacterium]
MTDRARQQPAASPDATSGIHHITALAGDPQLNIDFYRGALGLRLVKRTVNFDDPGSYHFYFGDQTGSPGTGITFFPWPGAPRGVPGSGEVTATAFCVPRGSLDRWADRVRTWGALNAVRSTRFGEPLLAFEDPDGTALELIETPGAEALAPWTGDGVDSATAIRGFHSATLSLRDPAHTADLLTRHLGMTRAGADGNRLRFAATGRTAHGRPAAVGRVIDLLHTPDLAPGRSGTGTVHHIAVRATGDEQQARLQRSLAAGGYGVTPVRERDYFRSVYFRERGGVLFEIATDGPGFTIDEAPEALGGALKLPRVYEPQRAQIEARLPKVSLDRPVPRTSSDPARAYHHVFLPPRGGRSDGRWLLLLHGTGGDEQDLLPLGEKLLPGAAMLSPRGDVSENGHFRFFKRFAEGVFDLDDVRRAATKLSAWVEAAAAEYGLDPAQGTAVGFSNGANVAAAALLTSGLSVTDAVLIRAMRTIEPLPQAIARGKRLLVLSGTADPIVPTANARGLVEQLGAAGAEVRHVELPVGHNLAPGDLAAAMEFVQRTPATAR